MALPKPVKLILAITCRDDLQREEIKELAIRRWGKIDFEGALNPYAQKTPFFEEAGPPLLRGWISFSHLVDPGQIASIKNAASDLEARFLSQGKRRVDLNVGILDLYKLVFTSTHPAPQRLYHSDGVYLEMQVLFMKGKCQTLPWSYEEFKSHLLDEEFFKLQNLYQEALQKKVPETSQRPTLPPVPLFRK